MKTKKTTTKPKTTKQTFISKEAEAKALLERTRTEANAKVKELKQRIKTAGEKAATELEKNIAQLKADHKKRQAKLKKMRKELSAA